MKRNQIWVALLYWPGEFKFFPGTLVFPAPELSDVATWAAVSGAETKGGWNIVHLESGITTGYGRTLSDALAHAKGTIDHLGRGHWARYPIELKTLN